MRQKKNPPEYNSGKRKRYGRTVIVQDDNIQKAIKKLRRKLDKMNLFQELYQRRYYIKPSQVRKRKKQIAKWKAKIAIENKLKQEKQGNLSKK